MGWRCTRKECGVADSKQRWSVPTSEQLDQAAEKSTKKPSWVQKLKLRTRVGSSRVLVAPPPILAPTSKAPAAPDLPESPAAPPPPSPSPISDRFPAASSTYRLRGDEIPGNRPISERTSQPPIVPPTAVPTPAPQVTRRPTVRKQEPPPVEPSPARPTSPTPKKTIRPTVKNPESARVEPSSTSPIAETTPPGSGSLWTPPPSGATRRKVRINKDALDRRGNTSKSRAPATSGAARSLVSGRCTLCGRLFPGTVERATFAYVQHECRGHAANDDWRSDK